MKGKKYVSNVDVAALSEVPMVTVYVVTRGKDGWGAYECQVPQHVMDGYPKTVICQPNPIGILTAKLSEALETRGFKTGK